MFFEWGVALHDLDIEAIRKGEKDPKLLKRQLKDIQTSKDLQGVSCGLVNDSNLFEWEVMLMINDDCKYYGGMTSPHPQ